MSIRHVAWAIKRPIKPTPKVVLIALADLADEDNTAFPSKRYLSELLGLSKRSVQRTVAELERDGYLVRLESNRPDGSQSSNVYELLLPGGETNLSRGEDREVSPIPKTKKTSSTKREKKRPIPASWEPTDSHRSMAESMGLKLQWEAERFRDHALMNDRRLVRWDRAFNNWLRNAKEFAAQRKGPTPKAKAVDLKFVRPVGEEVWSPDGTLSEHFIEWHNQAVKEGTIDEMDLTITRAQAEGL
jgi:biotin operon repressor